MTGRRRGVKVGRTPPPAPGAAAGILTLAVLVASVLCVVLKPAAVNPDGKTLELPLDLSWGFFVTAAGCLLGIAASAMLLSGRTEQVLEKIADGKSFVPPPPKAQSGPADRCPICEGPAQYNPDQKRWFCPACKSFL